MSGARPIVLSFATLAISAATLVHCGPARQAPPDPAAMRQTRWPACINKLMIEGMNACPAVEPSLGPEPACTARQTSTPTPPTQLELGALQPPPHRLAEHPPLSKAMALLEAPEPDMKKAEKAFDDAVASAPPNSQAKLWSHLGAARVHRELGDADAALDEARLARKIAITQPNMPLAPTRIAFVATYAAAGNPTSAYENVRAFSTPKEVPVAERMATTLKMLGELATELSAIGKLDGARIVMNRVRELDPDGACLHAVALTRLGRALGDRKATAAGLVALVSDVQTIADDSPLRTSCRKAAAELIAEQGDAWHTLGLATRDAVTLDYATQAHDVLLSLYDQEELDAHGVCVDRRQWAHQHADLLFTRGKWASCGKAYEVALHEDGRGERGERAALRTVTCRQRAWLDGDTRLELASDNEKMESTIQRTADWRSMLASFHRYICVARDDETRAEPVSNAAFARAKAFYDGGALWESAVAFRLLAFSPKRGGSSRQAAERYAVIMDDLAADDVCQIELQLDLEKLDRMHCQDAGGDDEVCTAINEVLTRISRPIL